jgi:protein gp37
MSDLFHKHVPLEFIDAVFATMQRTEHHSYQVLTKRSSLMRRYVNRRYANEPAPSHIWLGVSIENREHLSRIHHLKQVNATVRFISFEPLLGSIGAVDLDGIAWAIVGGESGPSARPMNPDWARELRDQCLAQGVAFFFKQWGGLNPKSGGRLLDGETWDDYPSVKRNGKSKHYHAA